MKISVVINTLNEELNIKRAISSVSFADEVLVCDMKSDDHTAQIARGMGARVITHKRVGYVEPARNFAISKVSGDWILILDADEEMPKKLAQRLRELADKPITSTYVELPRKNIIFGKWVKASFWWPDYNIRFFRKGAVIWRDEIHSNPKTTGEGLRLPDEEEWSIIHHHYQSISQYLMRMDRYTTIQARDLQQGGVKFNWRDLIKKPLSEFLSRFFANSGYEDGVHGLALSLLQAFSHLVIYLKLWELVKFEETSITIQEVKSEKRAAAVELDYWLKYVSLSRNRFLRTLQKAKNRLFT